MAAVITDSPAQQHLVLTERSARRISQDLYELGEERVTMQVIDLAKVKYQQPVGRIETTPLYQFKNPTHLARDDKPLPSCPRYRLVVSDGQNLVPAKFYPERLDIKTDHFVPEKIHGLVQNGELRKGCVISFKPNSHTQSGSGIVTIFSMRIEGYSEIIMAEGVEKLQPLHDGTMAFSPKNLHECTLPLDFDDSAQDPLPRPVLRLAKVIEDVVGYCTIAGGSVLAKYLYDLPGCTNCYERFYSSDIARICAKTTCKDIDLFVPLYPGKLDDFYGKQVENRSKESFFNLLHRALDELFQKYGLQHTPVVRDKIELSGVEDGGQDYGWMRIFVGLKEKIEFRLVAPYGKVIERPIQILVMDAMPDSANELWRDVVVKGFDADVIKTVAVIDDKACLEKVLFSVDNQEKNLSLHNSPLSGTFNYTMRPCHSFPRMMERLNKYKQRGFDLKGFEFDDRVSDEWKHHILTEFHRKCKFVFQSFIRVPYNCSHKRNHVLDFLHYSRCTPLDQRNVCHLCPKLFSRRVSGTHYALSSRKPRPP